MGQHSCLMAGANAPAFCTWTRCSSATRARTRRRSLQTRPTASTYLSVKRKRSALIDTSPSRLVYPPQILPVSMGSGQKQTPSAAPWCHALPKHSTRAWPPPCAITPLPCAGGSGPCLLPLPLHGPELGTCAGSRSPAACVAPHAEREHWLAASLDNALSHPAFT